MGQSMDQKDNKQWRTIALLLGGQLLLKHDDITALNLALVECRLHLHGLDHQGLDLLLSANACEYRKNVSYFAYKDNATP